MNKNELENMYINDEETADTPAADRPAEKRGKSGKKNSLPGWMNVLIGITIGVLICAGAFTIMATSSKATSRDLDYNSKIDLILSYLSMYYLNDLDEQMIEDALAKGLMENIGDKYAQYYTVEEFNELLEEVNGSYAGIGVQVAMNDDGFVEVYKVFEGSPAQEAGILIKDLIVEADGVRDFPTLDDLVSIVRGAPGTTVDIVIDRKGEEIPVTIERRTIEIDSIYSQMLSEKTGYIAIEEFNATTVPQFNAAIDSLTEEGMESLIIDLRDNPGGDYDSVVAICDRVVPEGVIVTVEDRLGGMHTDNSDAECLDIPIVLLVNENTASAAELFTMCLRDYDMAEIVGTRTYGKGIVQSIFRLVDGSGLKFTTEKYYGPAGDWIQDTGIEPDYIIEFPEEVYEDGIIDIYEDVQLHKASELLGLDFLKDSYPVLEDKMTEDAPAEDAE